MDNNSFEFVDKCSFKVVGRRAVTPQPGGTWDVARSDGSIKQMEKLKPEAPMLGICFGFDENGNNDYMVAIEHTEDIEGLESYTYPDAKWLVYRAAGSLSENVLGNGWDYVTNTLLPKYKIRKAQLPTMEIYVNWDKLNNKCEIEIHVPYENE